MEITKDLRNDKEGLLSYFRSRSYEILSELALAVLGSRLQEKGFCA